MIGLLVVLALLVLALVVLALVVVALVVVALVVVALVVSLASYASPQSLLRNNFFCFFSGAASRISLSRLF